MPTISEETLLVTIANVQTVRALASSYDQDKFNSYLREVQREYVRLLIGNELYIDLLANTTAENYAELLDGVAYESDGNQISFYGLRMYIIYMWLYLYSKEGGIVYSETGKSEFDFSEVKKPSSGLTQDVISQFQFKAKIYADQVIKYLEDNATKFPKYKLSVINTKQTKSFMFNVIGESYPKDGVL